MAHPDNAVELWALYKKRTTECEWFDLSQLESITTMLTRLTYYTGRFDLSHRRGSWGTSGNTETFYEKFQNNDVTMWSGCSSYRQGSWLNRISGSLFYILFNHIQTTPFPTILTARLVSQLTLR